VLIRRHAGPAACSSLFIMPERTALGPPPDCHQAGTS